MAKATQPNPKAKFIDFQDVKQKVKIEDAAKRLELSLKPAGPQLRGACPACKSGGDRALVITPAKQVFYCFASSEGGDVIALAAHILSCPMKEAAAFLSDPVTGHAQAEPDTKPDMAGKPAPVRTDPVTVPEKKKAGLNPLTYLQPEHPLVQALGISPETCQHFGAGYAPKGIMRGRLAIPIHDADGVLVAYCGQALNGEMPELVFPDGFEAEGIVFNLHRVSGTSAHVARNVISLLLAYECGVTDCVTYLVSNISINLLQRIASLKK